MIRTRVEADIFSLWTVTLVKKTKTLSFMLLAEMKVMFVGNLGFKMSKRPWKRPLMRFILSFKGASTVINGRCFCALKWGSCLHCSQAKSQGQFFFCTALAKDTNSRQIRLIQTTQLQFPLSKCFHFTTSIPETLVNLASATLKTHYPFPSWAQGQFC